jgi:hypothetical protein
VVLLPPLFSLPRLHRAAAAAPDAAEILAGAAFERSGSEARLPSEHKAGTRHLRVVLMACGTTHQKTHTKHGGDTRVGCEFLYFFSMLP